MDILTKNMIWTSSDLLLNYGALDKGIYTLVGTVSSSLPFTLTVLVDGVVVPYKYDIYETDTYLITYNSSFTYLPFETVEKFELQFDTTEEKKINLQLWKTYPITIPVPLRGVPPPQNGLMEDFLNPSVEVSEPPTVSEVIV